MVHFNQVKTDRFLPVVFYKSDSGREPVRVWLTSLTKREKKAIGEDIKTVQFGWPIGMPLVEKLEKDLWEIRVKLDKKIARIMFTLTDNLIVLLHGFIKKTQKIPKKDLDLARSRMKEVKGGGFD